MKIRRFGFTLIELLVASAIIIILAGGGLAAYLDFNNRQILDTTADELKNNLRQARGWAMAGRKMADCNGNLVGYQVQFDTTNSQYKISIICPNTVWVTTFSYNSKVNLSLGRNPFVFQVLTGETGVKNAFNITLSLGSRSKRLEIKSNGEINYDD